MGYNTTALEFILDRLSGLGVLVAMHKAKGPATTVMFLGIVVDTARMELQLPAEKVTLILALVRQWKGRRSRRYSDFESFLGHLSHAATVIHQGQTFLKHLFDILAGARSRYHYVHLDNMVKADLLWWEHFLQRWNGMMFFRQFESPVIHIYTDASGSFGCRGVVVPSPGFTSNGWTLGRQRTSLSRSLYLLL